MEVSQVQQPSSNGRRRRGGWITFPFIIGTTVGMNLAGGGWSSNLIVYLIKEFNVKNINAAQIANVVNGTLNLFPVLGAIIADSFLDCFSAVWISSVISLLGITLLAVTASIPSLKPQPCVNGSGSDLCKAPTRAQFGVLYGGICLATMGQGGRAVIATMGANQFPDKPKNQTIFFNWFFFTMYVAVLIASTVVVYVEDNVSWECGFYVCAGANIVALGAFLVGTPFYRRPKSEGSPCTSLARVVVAAIRKRKLQLSPPENNFYYGKHILAKFTTPPPSTSFGFLNRAAMRGNGEVAADGSNKKPWRLCSVGEVEDFKTIIRIFPLWSTAIFLATPIAMNLSLSILQALTMDRHLGRHFQIPAGSIPVFVLLSTSLSLILFDRILSPAWRRLAGKPPTPLQRVGIGHVFNIAAMVVSAVVESKRRNAGPISVLWLLPQLALVGIGEAMHFPGQLELYYQEFPASLKNVSTSLAWVIIAISFYLSTALIDLLRRVTGWLPDNINHGRLDNVYWLVTVIGAFNFAYFLICSWFYKYQNVKEVGHGESNSLDIQSSL
ncbi:PREDICTED: protein NRT1/ PTR FAMILY 2.7-like [Ipomoea nil]|uniref:protein NRT1/ PTR FAMILY 2.7-like n=1 Tax=Ipomoea nil TaxID=35883 RepID=UPI000900BD0F|nr:PREDICTED: protein NRT1/ PTR FAMILY 2.7-like [Ipomoea nil]